jgi:hypothetical protein
MVQVLLCTSTARAVVDATVTGTSPSPASGRNRTSRVLESGKPRECTNLSIPLAGLMMIEGPRAGVPFNLNERRTEGRAGDGQLERHKAQSSFKFVALPGVWFNHEV